MAISVEAYEASKRAVREVVIAAASVIPPAGTDAEALRSWTKELVAAAAAIDAAVNELAGVVKEITLSGTVTDVANPARRANGSALRLAKVTIRSDQGDPKKPDAPWIDLRTEEGRRLAKSAEGLKGQRVTFTVRQVVEMANGQPVRNEAGYATRSRLLAIAPEAAQSAAA